MIKAIRIISRVELKQNMAFFTKGSFKDFFSCNELAFVSMHSTNKNPCELPECRSLLLRFDDLIIDTDWGITPAQEHVDQIRTFLHEIHQSPEEYLLVCQCDGGSSRSGAVGKYAAQLAGLPFETLVRENPRIKPNTLMQELFRIV